MGTISLVIPQIGQPDTTEDVKVQNAFTTIQTVINGNIDTNNLNAAAAIKDTQIASPNNAKRQLLLQSTSTASQGTGPGAAGDYILAPGGVPVSSGSSSGSVVPLWIGDSGPSGQPQDFQVPGKSAFCRVRATFASNAVSAGVTWFAALYQITALAGSGGSITYTFSVVASSATGNTTPTASQLGMAESAAFALPTAAAGFALGVNASAGMPAGTQIHITAQLYGYNA